MTGTCEMNDYTGPDGCTARASWVVSVGTRKADAQLSCGRHLNRTCDGLYANERRASATLTVTPISEWRTA